MEVSNLEESDLKGMEVCNFGGTEMALPLDLIEQKEIFFKVVSMETWKNVLTPADRKHLETFLPVLPTDYPHAQEENISALLDGENFRFGNPVQQFQQKLKDGYFYPDVVKYKKLCRKAKYKEYKIQQQRYHKKLLREILISRQEILDQIGRQGPGEPIKTSGHTPSVDNFAMEHRVNTQLKRILSECRQQCQDGNVSSDDEERNVAAPFGPAMGLFMTPYHMLPGVFSGIPGMLGAGMPYPGYHGFPFPSPTVHRAPSPNVVTEDDFQKMILMHRERRLANEDHPELDTRFTSIQDIIVRTNPTKKSSKSSELTKKKDKKAGKVKRKLKQKLQQKQERQAQVKADQSQTAKKEEAAQEPQSIPQVTVPSEDMPCFFSLLRQIFHSFPDSKANLQKIEELVKTWQLSPSCAASPWSTQEPDWIKLVYSALIYLSGSSGETPATFVPFVDFKERPQQWKWIGSHRDSDEELEPLCEDWLRIKGEVTSKKGAATEADSSSAPVPRVKTDFVVRPSTEDERAAFRDQENERYANPHKAFTFRMHGFESVVGPVKGVFSKDTNLNKAREHSLLISLRPPYVTILTLVRDAASRLPNGEGTRAEVCELLRDSQFLNTNSSDAQIHTVVSGALDRLHYERDPCVKYDSNRKVWIYLHRNRSEEEFEKIHQASAAAARAKKLQKPRVTRQPKNKDNTATPASLPAPVSTQKEEQEPTAAVSISPHTAKLSAQVSVLTSFPQDEQSLVKVPPRLQHTADPNLADSPGRKFTSALNTHTSVLNTADESVSRSPLQLPAHTVASDESRVEVQDSRKSGWSSEEETSDGSSASDHESESGSAGSSSEGERDVKMHQGGGKTLPGEDQRFAVADELDTQPMDWTQQGTQPMDHQAYGVEDVVGDSQENEQKFSGETSSEQGSGSDSDFSNVD